MSARKSWDIAPRAPKKPVAEPIAAPARARRFSDIQPVARPASKKRPAPKRVAAPPPPTRREAVRSTPRTPRVPLGKRRRSARRKIFVGVLVALLLLGALSLTLIWQPFLRVSEVRAEGPMGERVADYVRGQLIGTRWLIIPRNSIFFIPEEAIRSSVLTAFPEFDAVSIAPAGLTTLTVTPTLRAAVFRWCGTAEAPLPSCFSVDAQGYIFEEAPSEATSTLLTIYAPLGSAPEGTTPPIGSSIAAHESLPAIIQFVKVMRTLGADVVSLTLRGDEADLYTPAGTRITYVIGREQQAANLAASAFPTLSLNDGSLLYVDLRFESKVFFKKKGE